MASWRYYVGEASPIADQAAGRGEFTPCVHRGNWPGGSGRPFLGPGSLLTRRWRKPDSNHWSREGDRCPRVVVFVHADFSGGADATDIIRSRKLASRGDRWFKSGFLQRRSVANRVGNPASGPSLLP